MSDSQQPADTRHRNDMYGDVSRDADAHPPPIPAATVILLRDAPDGIEVLMLRKNSKISFGGMWVFPGGRIDAEDCPDGGDDDVAARNAAVRETAEEAGLGLDGNEFVHFAHWTPPPGNAKRFTTWFFAAVIDGDEEILIDGGEIEEHTWIRPADALARHGAGEIDLVPPTWVTLYQLCQFDAAAEALAWLDEQPVKVYQTRIGKRADGLRVAMWAGDAGYEDWDPDIEGPRHRLVMAEGGFLFENSVADYAVR